MMKNKLTRPISGSLGDGEWITYENPNSSPIICIAVDSSNSIWVGTLNKGVSKFNGSTWTSYTESNSGLVDNSVQCIAVDNNNNVWIGTRDGLSKFNGSSTWTSYTKSNSELIDNDIWSIAIDNNNNVWIVTYGGYLLKFNGSTWTTIIENSKIESIIVNNNDVWINGLLKFNGSTFTNYVENVENAIGHVILTSIATVDKKTNNIWVGAVFFGDKDDDMDYGLIKFNGSTGTGYKRSGSGSGSIGYVLIDRITARIAVDKNSNVWFATGNITVADKPTSLHKFVQK